jgi:hypothetical protein
MTGMHTDHHLSNNFAPDSGGSHKELILGPALVPRYISIARNETLVFDLKPRHLSGYQPSSLLPQKLRNRMIDSHRRGDILTTGSLTAWSDSARQDLVWLDQSLMRNGDIGRKLVSITVPSRSLTLLLLNTSVEEIEGKIRSLREELGNSQEEPSAFSMIEEFRREISEEFMGAIANFGFLCREREQSTEFLWKEDTINNDFASELARVLPLDFNRIEEVFVSLHSELLEKLLAERVTGDWGELRSQGKSIFINLKFS